MIMDDRAYGKEAQKSASAALRSRFSRGGLPPCPVAVALRLIGGRWRALIVLRLAREGACAHAALLAAFRPLLTQKVLTENLRALEAYGLVSRTVRPTLPPRTDYALTPLGRASVPALEALEAWGEVYRGAVGGAGAPG